MKKLLTLLLAITTISSYAQLKNGDSLPDLKFTQILNAPVKSATLAQLKGKVVLIEFWATWCGSCLVAMPHLKTLQAKYPKSLQVIAVTDETAARAGMYIKSKPANFWFAIDTARKVASFFPHQFIPHSILIGTDGKLVAITNPEAITAGVIDSLLHKRTVHLPEKIDNLMSHEDLIKQNFYAADSTKYRFMMQGEIKGGPGLSTTWLSDKVFSGRRLTCINLSLESLYRMAYGNFTYDRTINDTKPGKKEPVYCLDLIVNAPADLLPALNKELSKRFDLQAKINPMLKEVRVLRITDPAKFKLIKRNETNKRTYYSMHGQIDQQAMTMVDFADFLENYGVNNLVVDETGNREKLDIKFSFQPENPQSLLDVLAGMGLGLTKEQRSVDMLVLYRK